MARMTMKQYEKSGFDKEKKGEKEGSKADLATDRKALSAANKKLAKMPMAKAKKAMMAKKGK